MRMSVSDDECVKLLSSGPTDDLGYRRMKLWVSFFDHFSHRLTLLSQTIYTARHLSVKLVLIRC
jgi:hypothetical protein